MDEKETLLIKLTVLSTKMSDLMVLKMIYINQKNECPRKQNQ